MKSFTRILLCSAIASSLVACGGDNDSSSNNDLVNMTIIPTNIEALGDDYNYEGWIIVDGSPVSTGTFDIVEGQTAPSSFSIDEDMANGATAFVLTIEPEIDEDPMPSEVHIVAGDFENSTAMAVTDHPKALATDFSEMSGSFILATPTNGNTTPTQGIWYLKEPGPVEALVLPELPDGWLYEGWVVVDGSPVSTGTFSTAAGKDSDAAGETDGGPAFPGQDFLNPAIDLIGKTAVISVEPNPDNADGPFSLKPLVKGSIEDTTGLQLNSQNLVNNAAATLPSAVVTIK